MQNIISIGDIERAAWPCESQKSLPLYVGSGRCGAQFDAWGLMNLPNTAFRHADAWLSDENGVDRWKNVFCLGWRGATPAAPLNYNQKLTLWDGTLTTICEGSQGRWATRAGFHPGRRDWLFLDIEHTGNFPALELRGLAPLETHGNGGSVWSARLLGCLLTLEIASLEGRATLAPGENGVAIELGSGGRHQLRIGLARESRAASLLAERAALPTPDALAHERKNAWHRRWGSAWAQFPAPHLTAFWARSLFYLLCSYGPDERSPAAPTGWAAPGWDYGFPQDLSFVLPAFLRLGHFDIAKAWCENYRRELPRFQNYARDVWNAAGAMTPWHFPIGREVRLGAPGGDWRTLPNDDWAWYEYQIHNAAYPARMAHLTSHYLRDETWTREVAWPLVVEAARFFASFLERKNGKWSLWARPSSGQDEFGGHNAPNYLDALFGARYCLSSALELARELKIHLPEEDSWRAVLREGLAFERLLDSNSGILRSCEDSDWDFRRQKHPIQLGALAFLPQGNCPDEAAIRAFERRHELCIGGENGIFYGWTLPTLWLSAAHLGNFSALETDLDLTPRVGNVDENWVQFYESSPAHMPFFVTSHGLALQALSDIFVHDFWGQTTRTNSLPPNWSGASFAGFHTRDGQIHEGHF